MDCIPGLVSVIMSNYNTPEEYLRDAVESILKQTYENFEFIIVDDCSSNNSVDVIRSYHDLRIKLVLNKTNLGLTKSLNIALKKASGEFIARMDADDISDITRFEKQICYLNEHPKVVACGTSVELFGDGAYKNKQKTIYKELFEKEKLQIHFLFGNHNNIIHPTAMLRHKELTENDISYNEKYIYAQDYRMWIDCCNIGDCVNLSECLLKYRIHNKAVSTDKKDIQDDCAKQIMAEQLSWLGLSLPENWQNIHYGFFTGRKDYNLDCRKWIKAIIKANKKTKVYNEKKLESMLWKKWAETTYFELYKTNFVGKIKALFLLPIRYYPELLKIRKARKKRKSINEISE